MQNDLEKEENIQEENTAEMTEEEFEEIDNKMVDKSVTFKLFANEEGTTGVKIEGTDTRDIGDGPETYRYGCPFIGMVAYKWDDCLLEAKPEFDLEGLQGGIVGYKVKELKRVGFDIGRWFFGFLGEVTPEEDEKVLVFVVTDSGHLVWIHCYVE